MPALDVDGNELRVGDLVMMVDPKSGSSMKAGDIASVMKVDEGTSHERAVVMVGDPLIRRFAHRFRKVSDAN